MKIAYLDCFSGISGDMFLGALLDAGLPLEDLTECLRQLPLEGYQLAVSKETRSGILGTRFVVRPEAAQPPRSLESICEMIRKGRLNKQLESKSIEIFKNLARIEGKIHGLPPEKVHFHEVGGVDSIIDILGAVYGTQRLEIDAVFVSALPLGFGFVETAHGRIPVPAPATLEILNDIPVFDSGVSHELVTPTGAALIKGLANSFGPMPPMVIREVGYGAGKAELSDRPNLLRVLIGDLTSSQQTDTVVLLETNLDDTNPEWLGYMMDRLFEAGALDVVFFPVHMKKNRPGVQVQVIARPQDRDKLCDILFKESATLGIRFGYTQRQLVARSMTVVDSPWGELSVKKMKDRKGSFYFLPEYEACREIALKTGRPLREIFYWVMALNKPRRDYPLQAQDDSR